MAEVNKEFWKQRGVIEGELRELARQHDIDLVKNPHFAIGALTSMLATERVKNKKNV